MDTQQIRVAIVDEDPRFRKHLVKVFGKEPDIFVIAEAESILAGMRKIEKEKPDVILLDKDRPFTEGLESTETIVSRFPDTRVIVLSRLTKRIMTASLCQTWACYPLCQNCSTEDILAAIREGH